MNSSGTFRLPPQKLGVVPHAVTAERAVDFEVSGTLKVDTISAHTVNGPVEVTSNLQLNRGLTVNSGTVLFKDSLVILQRSHDERIDPDSSLNIYAQCLENEVILSGGCAKTSIYMDITYDYTQVNQNRHLCRVRNLDSTSPRRHYAYATCLRVR